VGHGVGLAVNDSSLVFCVEGHVKRAGRERSSDSSDIGFNAASDDGDYLDALGGGQLVSRYASGIKMKTKGSIAYPNGPSSTRKVSLNECNAAFEAL
jgi:hypothetical protein